MMYIEGHWETVDTLSDISRIVREYYNYGLADVLDEKIEILIDSFNNKIESLNIEIENLEDELSSLEYSLEYLD